MSVPHSKRNCDSFATKGTSIILSIFKIHHLLTIGINLSWGILTKRDFSYNLNLIAEKACEAFTNLRKTVTSAHLVNLGFYTGTQRAPRRALLGAPPKFFSSPTYSINIAMSSGKKQCTLDQVCPQVCQSSVLRLAPQYSKRH